MYLLKSINNPFISGLLGIAGIAMIVVSYSYLNEENMHSLIYNKNQENIHHLSQLNTKWAVSVEETKSFELRDFDEIALYTKNIRATLAELDASGLLDEQEVGEETVMQYKIFKNSFELKYEAIERYKSEQAILRNSVNFLQTSVNESLAIISNDEITNQITQSAASLNTYLLLNKLDLEKESKDQILQIESSIENESTFSKEAINTYMSHAKIILEYHPKVQKMIETANTVDIETLTQNVSASYFLHQNSRQKDVNYWRSMILAGAIGLLLSLVLLLSRFRENINREKGTQEKLKVAHTKIDKVNDDILNSESHAGQAHLAFATLNNIQNNISPLSTSIEILKKLTGPKELKATREEVIAVVTDLEYQKNELDLLNEAILSDEIKSNIPVNINELLSKVIITVKSEVNFPLNIKNMLGENTVVNNNPIAIFQIFLKLLRLSTHAPKTEDELDIHIHTWSSENDITVLMTIKDHNDPNDIFSEKGMTIFKDLLDQSGISIEIRARTNKGGSITLTIPKNPILSKNMPKNSTRLSTDMSKKAPLSVNIPQESYNSL